MPSLLCSSPTIVDQSFPRDDEQLEIVGIALGEIQAYLERDEALLVKTETLGVFVELFDWERAGPYPLLKTIYDLLTQWYLQPNESIVEVDLSEIDGLSARRYQNCSYRWQVTGANPEIRTSATIR